MGPFASPILLPVRQSRLLSGAINFSAAAVSAALVVEFHHDTRVYALVSIILLLTMLEHAVARRIFNTYRYVRMSSSGQFSLFLDSGENLDARLCPRVFVSRHLVSLVLQANGRMPVRFIFTDDNTPASDFRRLRVRLRFANAPV